MLNIFLETVALHDIAYIVLPRQLTGVLKSSAPKECGGCSEVKNEKPGRLDGWVVFVAPFCFPSAPHLHSSCAVRLVYWLAAVFGRKARRSTWSETVVTAHS